MTASGDPPGHPGVYVDQNIYDQGHIGFADDHVSSKDLEDLKFGWDEDLQKALIEKDSLLAASVQVLSKRLREAEKRNQELEALVTSKDERIMKLVDIIISRMGGSGEREDASTGSRGRAAQTESGALEGTPDGSGAETEG